MKGTDMEVLFKVLSKNGDRKANEDCVGSIEHNGRYLFALADGLGGHGKGDLASQRVVAQSFNVFQQGSGSLDETVVTCFETGQRSLLAAQKEQRLINEMKTTLVILCIQDGLASWGHIGDSRLYYFRGNKLITRTKDHSVPQMLASIGEIKEQEIRHHEDRNKLLRVMGTEWDKPKYETSGGRTRLTSGDVFLICSDGFWEWIDERHMIKTLKRSSDPNSWLGNMEDTVSKNGAGKNMDNYSAIAVWIR